MLPIGFRWGDTLADTPDILRGTLDLLVLKALSWGPSHGYGVARWVERPPTTRWR